MGRPRPRRGSQGIRNPGSGGKLVPPRGRTGRFQLQRADRCLPPHPRPVPTASRGSRSRIHLTNSEAFLNQIFSHERLATSTTSLAPAPEPDCASHGTCRGPGLGGVGQAGPADLQPGLTPLQWHSSKSRVVTTRRPGRRDRISCGRRGARQHPASPPAGPQVRPGLCVPPAGPECQKSSSRQEWPRQARPPSPSQRLHGRRQQALKLEVYLANEFSPRAAVGGREGRSRPAARPRLRPSLGVEGPGSGRPRPWRQGAWLGEGALSWPHGTPQSWRPLRQRPDISV